MHNPEFNVGDIQSTPLQAQQLHTAIQEYAAQCAEPEQRRRDFAYYADVLTHGIAPELMARQIIPEIPQHAIRSVEENLSVAARDVEIVNTSEFQLVSGVQVRRNVAQKNNKIYFGATYFKVLGRLAEQGPEYRLRFSATSTVETPIHILQRAQELIEGDPDDLALVSDPDILTEVRRLRNVNPNQQLILGTAGGEEWRELYEMNRVSFTEADVLISTIRRAAGSLS